MSVLDDLRSQVLAISGTEEKVEVNQRHLIDKILARYSAEFTVFRELLQNANDAGKRALTFSRSCLYVDAFRRNSFLLLSFFHAQMPWKLK